MKRYIVLFALSALLILTVAYLVQVTVAPAHELATAIRLDEETELIAVKGLITALRAALLLVFLLSTANMVMTGYIVRQSLGGKL